MLFSKNWLQSYFPNTLPADEEVARILTFRSFEVEGFEKKTLADGTVDTVFDVKVLPDRAHYALAHRGIAGELAAGLGIPLTSIKEYSVSAISTAPSLATALPLSIDPSIQAPSITIETPLCRRFAAFYAELGTDTSAVATPAYMVQRLEAVGQRSIHPLVDITNYVKFDVGQPMHAFDTAGLEGDLRAREGAPGEQLETLEGKPVEVGPGMIVIADAKRPLDIAGIKGGKYAEITAATNHVFVLSPNFDAASIRRASMKTGIRTDAGKRFENNLSPELCADGLLLTAQLIHTIYPGAKVGAFADVYPRPHVLTSVAVPHAYLEDRLGLTLKPEQVSDLLASCGITASLAEGIYTCTPPRLRIDIAIPDDVVDEVGRALGYDKVPLTLPETTAALITQAATGVIVEKTRDTAKATYMRSLIEARHMAESARNILISLGFAETYTPTIVATGAVEIANPLASDKRALRTNLTQNAEKSLEMNLLNAPLIGFDTIRQFEVGTIFPERNSELQSLVLAIAQTKKNKIKAVDSAREALEKLYHGPLSAPIEQVLSDAAKRYPPTRIIVEFPLATFVQLGWGTEVSAAAAMTDGLAAKALSLDKKFRQFSSQPHIVRDIALFVPLAITAQDAWTCIAEALKAIGAEPYIVRYGQFDEFKKEDQISYGYRIVFQTHDRTLSDEEVNAWMKAAYDTCSQKGWTVR